MRCYEDSVVANDREEARCHNDYGYGTRLIAGERVHENDVPDLADVEDDR